MQELWEEVSDGNAKKVPRNYLFQAFPMMFIGAEEITKYILKKTEFIGLDVP